MQVGENSHVYALVAGEPSGDTLGAGLMMAIKRRDPQAKFIGVGGPKMIHHGMSSCAKMEDLAVMGLTEVLLKLPKILKIRNRVTQNIIAARPCIMIGIDLPDFNLHVEAKVKASGIPTIHYVSPSVWAWREKRIEKIKQACDDVLVLLSFEKTWYAKRNVHCTYVGHTLANSIPLQIDQEVCRERISLAKSSVEPLKGKVMAILPGSRKSIISRMLPVYAHTARLIKKKLPDTVFVCTVQSYAIASLVKDLWLEVAPDLSLTVYVGNTQDVIASADAVLLTCGTIALETMLLKTPFIVAYKVSALSAFIARFLLKIDTYSLPNLIAGRKVVKEFIQEECTPQALAEEMYKLLSYDNILMKKEFENIHSSMRCNSDELACDAVFKLLNRTAAVEPENTDMVSFGETINFDPSSEPAFSEPNSNSESELASDSASSPEHGENLR